MIAQLLMYEYKFVNPHVLHGIYENDITRSCGQSCKGSGLVICDARTRCVSSTGSSSSIDSLEYLYSGERLRVRVMQRNRQSWRG